MATGGGASLRGGEREGPRRRGSSAFGEEDVGGMEGLDSIMVSSRRLQNA